MLPENGQTGRSMPTQKKLQLKFKNLANTTKDSKPIQKIYFVQ